MSNDYDPQLEKPRVEAMTPLQRIRAEAATREWIDVPAMLRKLDGVADPKLTASVPRNGFAGPIFAAGIGDDDVRFILTYDFDGMIEMSFSHPSRRPNNWDVNKVLKRLRLPAPLVEESKATGKLRHYVMQLGRLT